MLIGPCSLSRSSTNLDEAHLNFFMPHPFKFKQVWSYQKGEQKLVVWKSVPPSPDFVSLGMIATTSDDDPPIECVRCVPKGWCIPANMAPRRIWDNAGSGGKLGSFWIMNSLGLLFASEGNDPPKSDVWELRARKLWAAEGFVKLSTTSLEQINVHRMKTLESRQQKQDEQKQQQAMQLQPRPVQGMRLGRGENLF